jgi:GNAT superfamily N-acetyltransferase
MLIRRMQTSDVKAVAALARSNYDGVLAEYHSAPVVAWFRAEVTAASLRQEMEWKRVFVVEDAGEVIATGALAAFGSPEEPRHVVSQFYVRLDRQSSGVGTHLLGHLIAVAVDLGADILHVPSSRNAVRFYGRAGFVVDDLQPSADLEITWMTRPVRVSQRSLSSTSPSSTSPSPTSSSSGSDPRGA